MTNAAFSFTRTFAIGTVLGLFGCASDTPGRSPDDAADPGACPLTAYRARHVEIPASFADAIAFAFDLDADGTRDNWLGFASAAVHAMSPRFDLARVVDARLAAGLDWVVAIDRCNDDAPPASIALGRGVTTDDGLHVVLDDAAAPAAGPELAGGTFTIPLGVLSDAVGGSQPAWARAPLGRARLVALADETITVEVGFAIASGDITAVVAPNLAAYFTQQLAAGESDFALIADADGDGVVTTEELLATSTARSLLAADLDAEALGGPGSSVGIRIEAAR